jgi:hypothetical protein
MAALALEPEIFDYRRDGRIFAPCRFPGAAEQASPVCTVLVTLASVLGVLVLPVPLPSSTPAHASLIAFPVTVVLFPVGAPDSMQVLSI